MNEDYCVKDECIIITWLARDQPGFLDFAYRVRSLARIYRVTLVSPYRLTHAEFAIPDVEHCVLAYGEGRAEWIRYMLACGRMIRKRQPACAILLHSMVAPLALLTGKTPTALYWNEHPSRFTASPPGHPFYKRIARKMALRLFFMRAAKRAALVMPIGEAQQEDLMHIGCRAEQVRLIYMGVDHNFLRQDEQPARDDGAPLELIYSGTVNHLRGRDVMLEGVALANSERTIARLTIVGASEDQIAYCTQYADKLGIADAVTVSGRVSGEKIPGLLHKADFGLCFIEDLPWWRFNPPTKLFEFLVAGVPVIASDIRTHTDYVSNWYNGMICPYDSQSLADTIVQAWQRRATLPQLREGARQSGERYLWERIEPEFLQAVRAIARTPSHPAGEHPGTPPLLMKHRTSVDSVAGEP